MKIQILNKLYKDFWEIQKSFFIFLFLFFMSLYVFSAPDTPQKRVYIIPVKGEIERGLVYLVRRGVKEAEQNKASIIIIDMDTPGGRLDATQMIMRVLLDTKIETYTYVNNKASSAGACIAAATNHIYMSPASQIGATAPMIGGPETKISPTVEEKIISATRAIIAAAAEQNNHPPKIFEAMVDRDIEIKDIIEKGKLLTLTNKRAEADNAKVSKGTVNNIDGLLKKINADKVEVTRIKTSWAEVMARFVTGSVIAGILMMLGLLGVYVEIKTPGFGVGGTVAIICFALFFLGHYLAALTGWEELVLFFIGIILLSIEIFVTPGFGFMGITGIACIFVSFILAMSGTLPEFPGLPKISPLDLSQYRRALYTFMLAIIGSVISVVILGKYVLPRTSAWQYISLSSRETGFKSFKKDYSYLQGKTGVVLTTLRPSGKVIIEEEKIDVVAEGDFIEKDKKVEVVEVEGSRVVVREKV
jgi:membrane-bound serine protease (ClpP class)